MGKKDSGKMRLLTEVEMDAFWNQHIETVRPAIKELDRKQVEAIARAPFIVVTNAAK